jgi:hypothetical protein
VCTAVSRRCCCLRWEGIQHSQYCIEAGIVAASGWMGEGAHLEVVRLSTAAVLDFVTHDVETCQTTVDIL